MMLCYKNLCLSYFNHMVACKPSSLLLQGCLSCNLAGLLGLQGQGKAANQKHRKGGCFPTEANAFASVIRED